MRSISFVTWLKTQRHRRDVVGDFARDALRDTDRPPAKAMRPTWAEYLERCGASDGALEAFEKAWAEFESVTTNRDPNTTVSGVYSKETAVRILESSLADLLQELFRIRDDMGTANVGYLMMGSFSIGEMVALHEATTEVDRIIAQFEMSAPEGAILLGVRRIGEALNLIGGLDLMQEVANRVAEQPLRCLGHTDAGSDFGRQSAVLSHHWDQIGQWIA